MIATSSIAQQKMEKPSAHHTFDYPRNVLFVNPMNLTKGNLTLSYERFFKPQISYKITISGGDKANYIWLQFDANRYTSQPAKINHFIGLSAIAYESPILTGVPIYHPFNKFSESLEDVYFIGLQLKNGALFRITSFMYFEIDAAIGPAYNLSNKELLAIWTININLGVPF